MATMRCLLRGHSYGEVIAHPGCPCRADQTCSSCGRQVSRIRHGAVEAVPSPFAANVVVLRCAGCGEEHTQWMVERRSHPPGPPFA